MSTEEPQERILSHFETPYHRGTCDAATHVLRNRNDPCGDEVEIGLRIDGGIVREIWFEGRGCIVSQAAASMLVQALEGYLLASALAFSAQDMLRLFGAPLSPARWRCCLLAWQTLHKLLAIESASGPAVLGATEPPGEKT